MTPEEYAEAANCFGRLLDLMSEKELKLYSRRAERESLTKLANMERCAEMKRLHSVLEGEISERKIEA